MAGKVRAIGLEEGVVELLKQLGAAALPAPETPQERTARIGEKGKQGDHRRRVEWVLIWMVVGGLCVALLECLLVLFWPGRDPEATKLAFGLLASILTGLFGILAGRGLKAGE